LKIGVLNQLSELEKRVAISPEIVKKLITNHQIYIEAGAGYGANFTDKVYEEAGAKITSKDKVLQDSEIFFVIAPLSSENLKAINPGSILVGMMNSKDAEYKKLLTQLKIKIFDLEKLPRITRAQSMDVLSSQANIVGYKSVLIATEHYQKFFPMLMTAAGTVKAARVVVLGAGVAGLQAIATAKRLGAIIEASDVRPIVKEQVESLGAKFIDVPYETQEEKEIAEGASGYAKKMPDAWLQRQKLLVRESLKKADIVISTALIPGQKPPLLIEKETVNLMKTGSVIVDLAAGSGGVEYGNCELTKVNEVINHAGITIIGHTNIASMVATDASSLFAKNLFSFIQLIFNESHEFYLNQEDEIVTACQVIGD
jgi:NAD(P) transhydrogenase subunit alpha